LYVSTVTDSIVKKYDNLVNKCGFRNIWKTGQRGNEVIE
jgi:hypothetical protein